MRIGINNIIIFLLLIIYLAQPSQATIYLNLTPDNDTFLQSNFLNTSEGSNNTLYIGCSPCGGGNPNWLFSLLHFNITLNTTDVIRNASLTLYKNTSGTLRVDVEEAVESWNETNATWLNQPVRTGNIIDSKLIPSSTGLITWNVTNSVKGFSDGSVINYGWYLIDENDTLNNVGFSSKDSINSTFYPKLIISYGFSTPTVPVISYPSNDSRHYNNSINITWNTSIDADGDSINYNWQMSNRSDFSNYILQVNTSNNYTGSLTTKDGDKNYTRVRSYDGYEYSNWSDVVNFTENSAPVVNITSGYQPDLSPSSPTITNNLTIRFNVTDNESDVPANYTLWYKNGVLNTSWNNTLILNYTNNFTNGDSLYVIVFAGDSYENSTEVQSNQVIIGSSNTAPSLSGITLTPSTKKYNKTINISATTNITDSESSEVRLLTYRKFDNGTKNYLGNSSWGSPNNFTNVTVTIPWNDGLAHNIFAQSEDSGNVTGQNNLTSGEVYAVFTSDITSPTEVNSSVNVGTINIGEGVIITAYFSGQNANISSVIVRIERPDATIANWTMICNAGEIVQCTKLYTSTSDVGTYYVRFFYPLDESGNSNAISSSLSFNAQAIVSSGSSSGGGGGGGTIIIVNDTAKVPALTFKNVTDFRSTDEIKQLGECLSESILLPNKCTSGKIVTAIVTDVANWWIMGAAYIMSFFTVLGLAIASQKPRKYVQDSILYGTLTVVILLLLQLLGFNLYVFSYAFKDSSPALMSISIGAWSLIISIISDNLSYKKKSII